MTEVKRYIVQGIDHEFRSREAARLVEARLEEVDQQLNGVQAPAMLRVHTRYDGPKDFSTNGRVYADAQLEAVRAMDDLFFHQDNHPIGWATAWATKMLPTIVRPVVETESWVQVGKSHRTNVFKFLPGKDGTHDW